MLHSLIFRPALLALSMYLLVSGGCASTKPSKFYTLSPLTISERATKPEPAGHGVALGVGPIELPEHLDRPQIVTRTGAKADEILAQIEEDEDVSFLVLAAGAGKEGPGPLVTAIAGKAASTFPIPIVIVPGSLSDEEIDALAG